MALLTLTSTGTPYVCVIAADGKWWNTSGSPAFEAFNAANWASYAIAATQYGTSKAWYATMPAATAGVVDVVQFLRAGGSPAITDTAEATGSFSWDGTTLRDLSDVGAISGDATAADNLEAFTDGTGYAGGTIKMKVDLDTIKTQAITCAAGVTVGVYIGGTGAAALASEVTAARMGVLTDWIDGGRLDLLLDGVKTKTDGLNFTGSDVKATLDGEEVTPTAASKTGYTLTATTGLGNQSGSVGSVAGSVGSVTSGVTLANGAITDDSLAGNMEIVFKTDFGTNYNQTRNAWTTNVQDFVGTTGSDPFAGKVVAASVTAGVTLATGAIVTGSFGTCVAPAAFLSAADAADGTARGEWFVAKSGNDSNDGRSWGTAKLTLGAAKTAASAPAIINVGAGSYNERDLAKHGVHWNWLPGASVDYTGTSGAIFDDAGGTVSYMVLGYGRFVHIGASGDQHVIKQSGASSRVTFEADSLQSPYIATYVMGKLSLRAKELIGTSNIIDISGGSVVVNADFGSGACHADASMLNYSIGIATNTADAVVGASAGPGAFLIHDSLIWGSATGFASVQIEGAEPTVALVGCSVKSTTYDISATSAMGVYSTYLNSAKIDGTGIKTDLSTFTTNKQLIADSLKLAPTAGAPASESVNADLDTLKARIPQIISMAQIGGTGPYYVLSLDDSGASLPTAAEVLTALGTGAWITAAQISATVGWGGAALPTIGTSTLTAQQVWEYATRTLTAFGFTVAATGDWTTDADITQLLADLATAHGSGSWATATGFSTHSAADVVTVLGTGSTLTALAQASSWTSTLATNLGTLISDWTDAGRLDTILDATAAAAAKFETMVVVDGAVWDYTTAALAAAGGGMTAQQTRDAMLLEPTGGGDSIDDQLAGIAAGVPVSDKTGFKLAADGADLILKSSPFALAIGDAVISRDASNVEATAGKHSLCAVILAATKGERTATTFVIHTTTGGIFDTKTLTEDATLNPVASVT